MVESYVADGPYQPEEYAADQLLHARAGACATTAPTRPTTRSPGCSRPPATASWSTTPRRATSGFAATRADAWSVEVVPAPAGRDRAPPAPRPSTGWRCGSSPGPQPADALRRFTRDTGRQPNRRRPGRSGPGFRPTTTRRPRSRGCASRRAALGAADLRPLPALRRPARRRRRSARTAAAHDAGVAITTYFNPMICARLPAGLRRARRRRGAHRRRRRAPRTPTATAPTSTRTSSSASSTSSPTPGATPTRRCSTRRSATATTAGWRTSASTRRSTRSRPATIHGSRAHNPYPTEYHCAAHEATAARRPADRPLPALGLDRGGALRPGRLGRRPDHRLGLRRPALGGHPGAQRRRLGDRDLGLGHRRLLRPRRERAHPGAADPLGAARRRLAGDAHAGQRRRGARRARARRCSTPTRSPTGAATRSCTRSSTRTSPAPRTPTGGPACR